MSFEISEEDYLAHYGTLTYSGRYRWGSGEDPYQRLDKFLKTTISMKKDGFKEAEIAQALGFKNSSDLRSMVTVANYDRAYLDYTRAVTLREQGYGHTEIARRMGWPPEKESQVRKILAPHYLARQQKFETALESMRVQVNNKGVVDVGFGVQEALGLKETEKNTLIRALEMEGYNRYVVREPPRFKGADPSKTMVLAKSDIALRDIYKDPSVIQTFSGNKDIIKNNPSGTVKPLSLDKRRLQINYGGEGGEKADGLIYIRPGVKDISMGNAQYAQVRILVGDKHYLKGMAVYKDDLPKGVDVVFNTNKERGVPVFGDKKSSVLKPIKVDPNDPNNPFGTAIKKQLTEGKDKDMKAYSVVNVVNDETDWDAWSKNLPAQFLSKQSDKLVRNQLSATQVNRRDELNDIKALTNPTVKKHMLMKYADSADSSATHLKAAALPGQKTHVLIPVPSMKDNEIYAPNYDNGTRVALVRFPHAGPFEIPELIVNNNHKDAVKLFKDKPKAAVAINSNVAERLSGADFDGDTVLVIPNNSGRVKSKAPLAGLSNFDPHTQYREVPGMKMMTKNGTQMEMGKISNLITDMDIQGATDSEMARAVKHSMVVIDAEKHRLNYKQSEIDNGIPALRKKYQDGGGASTLISRAKSPERVPEIRVRRAAEGGRYNEDGSIAYVKTDREYVDKKTGKTVRAITKAPKMELTRDAHELSSGTKKEALYADHANTMKALANEARKEYMRTPNLQRNPEAAKKYAKEVGELEDALRIAIANAPKERLAQRAANARVAAVLEDNPDMSKDDLKKYKARALKTARERVGAKKTQIYPTDEQWKAIQEGAISNHKLEQILRHGDQDRIVALATPKASREISVSKQSQIKALAARGYTQAEIADRLGISTTTVNEYT